MLFEPNTHVVTLNGTFIQISDLNAKLSAILIDIRLLLKVLDVIKVEKRTMKTENGSLQKMYEDLYASTIACSKNI